MAGKKGAKWRVLKPWAPSPEAANAKENYLLFAKRQESGFWAKASRSSNGCLEWTGQLDKDGYGRFAVSLPRLTKHKQVQHHARAPRLAYELTYGRIAGDLLVLHSCDNPKCVEPTHLSVGTQLQNRREAVLRRRVPRGGTHHSAKLTEAQAAEVIALRSSGENTAEIARRFGIASCTVRQIGIYNWKHLA